MSSDNVMRNIKLIVAYDGTAYHGFQRQLNANTIQEVLETKLAGIFGHSLKITAAGRTDAGVHAYRQVVNFRTTGTIPVEKITIAARTKLPPDITVISAEEVAPDFHARMSALSKIYMYRIYQGLGLQPFLRNYAWYVYQPLDVEAMHEAAQVVVGTHDFSAFRAAGSETVNPVRTIFEASCHFSDDIIELKFWGTGFLYHMVRNLAGTLVNVGKRIITAEDFRTILTGRDRHAAGITAPARGLYLQQVFY